MPRTNLYYAALPLWLEGLSYKAIAIRLGLRHRQHVQQLFAPVHAVRLQVRAEAHGKCEDCGLRLLNGHIHHKTRTNPPNRRENLRYLCIRCHHIAHLPCMSMKTGQI
jgi:hypothetical protein